MEVLKIENNMARVSSGGIETDVAIDLVEGVNVGDYVIVHAGYAIQSLPPEEAKETLAILKRLEESWDE
jgi:hydrogenase expression/formation protein HypC